MQTPSKEEVLKDIGDAAERMGLDLEDLTEMIDDVLDDAIGKIGGLRDAAIAGNLEQTSAVAHDIKGSCLNYGILAPAELAKSVEKEPSDAAGRIEQLDQVLQAIKALGI